MKPVVTFTEMFLSPKVGGIAVIGGLEGHPRQAISGPGGIRGEVVRTSRVVRVQMTCGTCGDKVEEFETENTVYRPKAAA